MRQKTWIVFAHGEYPYQVRKIIFFFNKEKLLKSKRLNCIQNKFQQEKISIF